MDGDRAVVRGYIDGCFDIMHSGHFNAIRQAKSICDMLIVGIHSDTEIEENKALPVMTQAERYGLLGHVKWIDEILYDVPYSPHISTLERAKADFCVHGDDMPVNAQGVCAYDEMRDAGRLRVVKRTEGVSTTDLIGRLLTLSRTSHTAERDPTSPPLGVRVNADDAIEHCAPHQKGRSPRTASLSPTSLRPGEEPTGRNFSVSPVSSPLGADGRAGHPSVAQHLALPNELMALVNELAEKYRMSPADLGRLTESLSSNLATRAPTSGVSDESAGVVDCEGLAFEEAPVGDAIRTQAPVHLLASTRRIAEFASSNQPGENDKVVYVVGSFDMFHVGHAQFFQDARALGTFLLVGIHDDFTVGQKKGPSFPMMNLTERVLNVCACKWVDEVIIGAPSFVTQDLIKTWDIHVVARGSEHMRNEVTTSQVGDYYAVPRKQGIYHEVPSKWKDLCHETIVRRIMRSREVYVRRNKDRAQREDDYYASKDKTTQPSEK